MVSAKMRRSELPTHRKQEQELAHADGGEEGGQQVCFQQKHGAWGFPEQLRKRLGGEG